MTKNQIIGALCEGLTTSVQIIQLKALVNQLFFLKSAGFDPTNSIVNFGPPIARRIVAVNTNFNPIRVGMKILEELNQVNLDQFSLEEQAFLCAKLSEKIIKKYI
jgi:hypothetical protein